MYRQIATFIILIGLLSSLPIIALGVYYASPTLENLGFRLIWMFFLGAGMVKILEMIDIEIDNYSKKKKKKNKDKTKIA